MESNFISTKAVCTLYNIQFSFIQDLYNIGLIPLKVSENDHFIHHDHMGDLEKMIRLHQDLDINIEGIDVVFNLLQKQKALELEIMELRNKLRLLDNLEQ